MRFARLANTLLKDEESARCNDEEAWEKRNVYSLDLKLQQSHY